LWIARNGRISIRPRGPGSDGTTDESDAIDADTWYEDLDGDGYGNGLVEQQACDQPSGWVLPATDCDDDAYDVHPGATELCNGYDDDCDGTTDEDDADDTTAWYEDLDGDGHGNGLVETWACEQPAGWARTAVDCDDTDAAVHPGADEICNGVDDDCNGTVDQDEAVLGSAEDCAAYSCKEIIDTLTASPADGVFWIDPLASGSPFEVYCDMTTDGGGYTFLKVDYGSQAYAVYAERTCASSGMQLFIPRTEEHQLAGLELARSSSFGPSGSDDYMRIMGIYPTSRGANCSRVAFNSGACTAWVASDGGPYWVGDTTSITEPNGDNDTDSSMYYLWNADGTVSWYNDIYSPGYTSQYFICDVGDKH
jgi:hypothetical protein